MLLCCINQMADEGGDLMPATTVPEITDRIKRWRKTHPGQPPKKIKWWDHGAPGVPLVGPNDVINPGSKDTDDLVDAMGPGCVLCLEGCNIGYGEDGQQFRDAWKKRYPKNPVEVSPSKGIVNPFPVGPGIIRVPAKKKDKGPAIWPGILKPIRWIIEHPPRPPERGPKY